MKAKNDPRHEARRLALNVIYSKNLGNTSDSKHFFKTTLEIKKYNKDIFYMIVDNYYDNIEEIQGISKEALKTWSKDQLLEIDLIIINMCLLEIMILKKTPTKVGVDEAIELSKEFGGEKSNKFVNGVLAKIIKDNNLK